MPSSQLRETIRQFTPNWFAATMGTGILALILPQIPKVGPHLHVLGLGLWLFNIALFILFSAMYALRWILFWNEAKRIFSHSTVSMFFGTIPMGLATIINGFLIFGVPLWGTTIVDVAKILWWLDVALSLASGVLLPYFMFTRQEHRLEKMTAIWLLPIVAAEVAAVSGGLLIPHLSNSQEQFLVLMTSYVLWAYSLPVAMIIITILFMRMVLHKLPPDSMAASSWLPLGPLGTGSLGLLVLGLEAPSIMAAQGMPMLGTIINAFGLIGGLLLWGAGLWWMLLAVLITLRHLRGGIPFNLGWWGYTFPLGVFTLTSLKLGSVLNIVALEILGSGQAVILTAMWMLVAALTIRGGWNGRLFVSPCIASEN